MPVIAAVLFLFLVLLAPLVLIPLSLVMRYRGGTARRQARAWLTTLNLATLALSTAIFLLMAAATNVWVPHAFLYSALGLLAGAVLGVVGLALTRWEPTPTSLYYTPSRWPILAILLAVTSRFFYGIWRGWHAWQARPDDTSWLAAAGAAGSLAIGAVVLGYYLSYVAGVRRRLKRPGWTLPPPAQSSSGGSGISR
jgi:hypothetical protein